MWLISVKLLIRQPHVHSTDDIIKNSAQKEDIFCRRTIQDSHEAYAYPKKGFIWLGAEETEGCAEFEFEEGAGGEEGATCRGKFSWNPKNAMLKIDPQVIRPDFALTFFN